ncbi:MAG TPA: metalloregulator ArsR/SmtB family transcription factor [bacterium]|nr:metalloregulator ArsR/SmtB family transcription factor [bacterium]
MARAATTTDAFNAIAEPRRRAIIGALRDGRHHTVRDVMGRLRMAQPTASKHLGVLRRVGIVSVHRQGRFRLYRLNAEALKPVHDWAQEFERYWTHQVDRIKARAEREALEQALKRRAGADDKEAE